MYENHWLCVLFTKILQDIKLFKIGKIVLFKIGTFGMDKTVSLKETLRKKESWKMVHSEIIVKLPKSNFWDFDFIS